VLQRLPLKNVIFGYYSMTINKNTKKPWPTKDAMVQIYEQNLCGGETSEFYSGLGSHHPETVEPYIAVVTPF
jgi:hypothetical protein